MLASRACHAEVVVLGFCVCWFRLRGRTVAVTIPKIRTADPVV